MLWLDFPESKLQECDMQSLCRFEESAKDIALHQQICVLAMHQEKKKTAIFTIQ
jgi:hypothetical protein